MDGKEYTMVTPWMENGTIINFLRKKPQADPLKLARNTFHFVRLLTQPGRSWRARRAVFSISTAWISPMVT